VRDAFVKVDPALETSPYMQIFEQVRALIQRGELAAETPLPTVRQLAGDLNVAPNTVARAYADLQQGGWIRTDGRRGTRVTPRVPTADKGVRSKALRDAVGTFVNALVHRGYSEAEIAAEVRRFIPA
jgi:DNA-binding transcriptional regulator YhcF (GntR family)